MIIYLFIFSFIGSLNFFLPSSFSPVAFCLGHGRNTSDPQRWTHNTHNLNTPVDASDHVTRLQTPFALLWHQRSKWKILKHKMKKGNLEGGTRPLAQHQSGRPCFLNSLRVCVCIEAPNSPVVKSVGGGRLTAGPEAAQPKGRSFKNKNKKKTYFLYPPAHGDII